MALTTRRLAAIRPSEWLADPGRKGAGRLIAFGMKSGGASFYFRYTLPNGKRDSLPIGRYDPRGQEGLTLQQASERAGDLSRRYQAGNRDLRAILKTEAREAERRRAEAIATQEGEKIRQAATLGRLLDGYADSLERAGKPSARGTRNALYLHVRDAWPEYWAKPAADVDLDELVAIVGRLVEAGKKREAGKLRSYLRAAYSAAVAARQKPDGLPALRELGLKVNPARELATLDGGKGGARTRALSVAELRAYWRKIEVIPAPVGALLRFHLLTGAQRLEQLARLTEADWDRDVHMIRLLDAKGRRLQPRTHYVPLLLDAEMALEAMTVWREDEGDEREQPLSPQSRYLFTITVGKTGAVYTTIRNHVREVAKAMANDGELPGGPFTPGDLRRTVETRLAALGVSREVRAQLQSHGLGGVQGRHYDAHDYASEKRIALEALYRLLVDSESAVSLIRRRA